MCDYSLHAVRSRPAQVADVLTVSRLSLSTSGLAAPEDGDCAVCLKPGTELAIAGTLCLADGRILSGLDTARFIQLDTDNPHTHHDALEFPDGRQVKINDIGLGLTLRVIQLPAEPIQDKPPIQAIEDQQQPAREPERVA